MRVGEISDIRWKEVRRRGGIGHKVEGGGEVSGIKWKEKDMIRI